MAFKVILCVAAMAIACAQAKPGGPAAYSISAPSVDHASVGNTQEHTVKGHYGQSSQSDYASQVQTAHSQSHVQRSSISNDAGLAPAAHYAAPAAHAIAAPAVGASYAVGVGHTAPAQIQGLAYASHGYAAAPALAYGGHYGAQYGGGGHYAATAPALQLSGVGLGLGLGHYGQIGHLGLGAAGLAYGGYGAYSSGPALSHGYAQVAAAPAQVVKYAAAPAYAPGIIGHGYAPAAYAAPAYAAHLGGPVLKAAVAAPALVHTSVSGHGIQYGY
ncbi:cuticle protein 21.3 isoform X1 [Drosophila obscura]|uniref:cuticle protein 21.3 isoform X1 n=1 Tax=Drosophila obscura TaxID=7282 RepID=UPI000BA179BB|nr:cuticle protein 21.3 isoform X1 [Drosophila obscura]